MRQIVLTYVRAQSADVGARFTGPGMQGSMKPWAGSVTLELGRHFMRSY